MFYVLFILLFIIFFMLYQHHKERHTIPFTLVLVAYFFAILSMMIYYSRDAYYYNVIKITFICRILYGGIFSSFLFPVLT